MANRIQLRRGTSTEWIQFNPVLAEAELGVEIDTGRFKIGDGATPWQTLKYERPLESIDATPNTLALRDSNSSLKVKNITLSTGGKLFGTSTSADKLSVARLIGASSNSDLTGSASFDGSSNVDINFQLDEIFTGSTNISYTKFNVDSKGRITSAQNPTTLSGYGILDAQPLNGILTAISNIGTGLGFLAKVETSTANTANTVVRYLEVSSGELTVDNPLGTAGNPIIGLADTTVTAGSYNTESYTSASGSETVNTTKFTVDQFGRFTSATTIPIATASETQKGLASFNAEDFDVSAAGVVTIAAQGVDNDQLQNPKIVLGTTDYVLGTTYTGFTTISDLTVDTDTLHVDKVNHRLGVGTTTPGNFKIDIVGTGRISGALTSTISGQRPIWSSFGTASTAESGTSPFTVTSTRKVTNLNVDFLDDLTSLDFLRRTDDFNNANNEGNQYIATNFWIDATNVTVRDPIIDIGGGAKGAALTSSHTSDRGLTLQYFSGSSRRAFVGWDTSSSGFALVENATVSNEVISGTYADLNLGDTTLRSGSLTIKSGGTNAGTLAATGETTVFSVTHGTGNTYILGTLDVINDVAVNTNKFNITASTGNTSIAGTLDVYGNVFVNDDKFMITSSTGNTYIEGTLEVNGNSSVNSNFDVDGNTTLVGNLTANSNVTLGDASTDSLIVNATSTFNAPVTLSGSNNLTVGGDISITGNLTVNGTTTTVNSTTVTIDDPIITLGGDSVPTTDDNKDRGVEFRYYDTQARLGFFGWDDSYSTLAGTTGGYRFLYNATNASEVFSGTDAGIVAGNLALTTGTESSSATTGDLVVSGGVGIGKVLNVTGNVNINTNKFNIVAATGNTSIAGTLGVTGATTLSSTLAVTGVTTLNNTVTLVGSNTASTEVFRIQNASATDKFVVDSANGNTTISGTIAVTGASTLSSTLGVTGATTLSSTLGVTGATTLSSTLGVTGATTLSSTLGVTGATTLSSTLAVTDNTTLNKNVTIVGSDTASTEFFKIQNGSSVDKFVVDSSSGNTTISGTVGVTGATTLSSTLAVTGNTTLNSNVTIAGSTSTETEYFRITDGSATRFEVDSANGNTSITGIVAITNTTDSSSSTDTNSSFRTAGGIAVAKKAFIGGTLDVTGASTLGSTLNVANDFSVATNKFNVLASTGNTSIAGTLTVTDNTTLNRNVTIVGSDTASTEFFKIQNGSSSDKFVVDSSSGNTTISGTLGVTGATALSSTLTVTGASQINNTLGVTGVTSITNNTDSTATNNGALVVTGGVGIGTQLRVGGNTTITGDLAVNGADITTTATGTATLFNTNATTLNVGGAATSVTIGATTGTATIRNASTVLSGDLAVQGGDITSSSTTFNFVNGTVTTLNIGGAANTISVGSGSSTATFNNNVTVTGNLTVNGTTTTINSTTISVDDKNIELGSVASPDDTTANGGGITLKGSTDKTLNWVSTGSNWTSSENFDLVTGKVYKINNTSVLSSTTLGSGVVNSSLTNLGTLTELTVSGNTTINNISIASGTSTVTTSGSNNLVLTPGGKTTTTKDFDISATLNVVGQLNADNLRIDGNVISSTNTNGNITLTPNGAGVVETLNDVNFGSGVDASTLTIVGQANVDNLRLDGNVISSTNTNGNITLTPNGTGKTTTAKDVDITATLSVTGQLNADNLRLDANTLSSTNTNGDIVLDPNGTGNVQFTGGSSQNFVINDGSTNKFTVESTTGNTVVEGTLNVTGNTTVTGSFALNSGGSTTFTTFNNAAGITAREISITGSGGPGTNHNIDLAVDNSGGTNNTAVAVKYFIVVTKSSNNKRMMTEFATFWDDSYGTGELHTVEYALSDPNSLGYTFDMAWVDGGGSIGVRPTLRISNVATNENVIVRVYKTYLY